MVTAVVTDRSTMTEVARRFLSFLLPRSRLTIEVVPGVAYCSILLMILEYWRLNVHALVSHMQDSPVHWPS